MPNVYHNSFGLPCSASYKKQTSCLLEGKGRDSITVVVARSDDFGSLASSSAARCCLLWLSFQHRFFRRAWISPAFASATMPLVTWVRSIVFLFYRLHILHESTSGRWPARSINWHFLEAAAEQDNTKRLLTLKSTSLRANYLFTLNDALQQSYASSNFSVGIYDHLLHFPLSARQPICRPSISKIARSYAI